MEAVWIMVLLWCSAVTVCVSGTCDGHSLDGCTLKSGLAVCQDVDLPDLSGFLPDCVSRIEARFGSAALSPGNANFSRLQNLTDLSLLNQIITYNQFSGLNRLVKLSFTGYWFTIGGAETIFDAKQLQLLEVKNGTLGFEGFFARFVNLASNPIKVLNLINIQHLSSLGKTYSSILNMSKILCPFGKTLEVLDLRYNDIVGLHLNQKHLFCFLKLRYINLEHNLLRGEVFYMDDLPGHNAVLISWSLSPALRDARLSYQWSFERETSNFMTNIGYNASTDVVLAALSKEDKVLADDDSHKGVYWDILQYAPVGSNILPITLFMTYKDYIDFISEKCLGEKFNIFKHGLCLMTHWKEGGTDPCIFLSCFTALTNYQEACQRAPNKHKFIRNKVGDLCGLDDCDYKMPMAIPPNIKVYESSHRNDNMYFNPWYDNYARYKNVQLCIYEGNQLETLDLSNMAASNFDSWHYFRIRGLKKLRFINYSNNKFPSFHPEFFFDMPNLESVQIGGNTLNMEGHLTQDTFFNNTQLQILNLSHTNLRSASPDVFLSHHNLKVLDLSGNNFEADTLSFNLTSQNITAIYLKDNVLTRLNHNMLQVLDTIEYFDLDLSGNPLVCDCDSIYFVKWIQSKKRKINFINGEDYRCTQSSTWVKLMSVDVEALTVRCDGRRPVIVAVFTTLAVVVSVALSVLTYCKRWKLRTLIYRMRRKLRARNGAEELMMSEYDAYVLYSGKEEDRLWVHRVLLETLENKYGLKLHIHLRDFMPGEYIADNIKDAIEKSRKVIAVLSPNFMESQWCKEEIYMAHAYDPQKLVMILYKPIPLVTQTEIPQLVSHLIQTQTYAEWRENPQAEKLFWEKLVKVLFDA